MKPLTRTSVLVAILWTTSSSWALPTGADTSTGTLSKRATGVNSGVPRHYLNGLPTFKTFGSGSAAEDVNANLDINADLPIEIAKVNNGNDDGASGIPNYMASPISSTTTSNDNNNNDGVGPDYAVNPINANNYRSLYNPDANVNPRLAAYTQNRPYRPVGGLNDISVNDLLPPGRELRPNYAGLLRGEEEGYRNGYRNLGDMLASMPPSQELAESRFT